MSMEMPPTVVAVYVCVTSHDVMLYQVDLSVSPPPVVSISVVVVAASVATDVSVR